MIRRILAALLGRFRAAPRQWTEPAELEQQCRTAQAPVILDVRNPDELVGPLGHIPGARNIPIDTLPALMGELASLRDREVVLVCKTDKRSARAAEALREAGFERVSVLRGGMERWNAENLSVQRGDVSERAST